MTSSTLQASIVRGIHLGLWIPLAALVLLGLLATFASYLPAFMGSAVAWLSSCPYRRFAGEPCPLCGGLTALTFLLRGDLTAALSSNGLAVFVAPILVTEFGYRLYRSIKPALRLKEELAVLSVSIAMGALLVASN